MNLDRARELVEQELLPRAELDTAQATADATEAQIASATAELARAVQALAASERRVEQARAQTARARDVVAKTEITAPMDGVVSRLNVRQGRWS